MWRTFSDIFMWDEYGFRTSLWGLPLGLVLAYFLSQGYFTCGPGPDPGWGAKAAVFKSEKPIPGRVPLEKWGGSAEARMLRESVSRISKDNASLRSVVVVRDKPMKYLASPRREVSPLVRRHVDGYPLIFCGMAQIKGKAVRFSYMPQIQELIVLEPQPLSGADLAKEDWREVRRSRKIEEEYQRMCGRPLEAGVLVSSLAQP